MKKATITLPLKKYRKLKKLIKGYLQGMAFHQEREQRASSRATKAQEDEQLMVDTWDKHSHAICDALGDAYYSDDGAGFDYNNMVKGIEVLKAEVSSIAKLHNREAEELIELRALFAHVHAWAQQGSRSRCSTKKSLALWDKVKRIREFYAKATG